LENDFLNALPQCSLDGTSIEPLCHLGLRGLSEDPTRRIRGPKEDPKRRQRGEKGIFRGLSEDLVMKMCHSSLVCYHSSQVL
jgi:hypothetical protein